MYQKAIENRNGTVGIDGKAVSAAIDRWYWTLRPNRIVRHELGGFGCPWRYQDGRQCHSFAGERTLHDGYGYCAIHEGKASRKAWEMAYDLAQEMDITPWEALLMSVRKAAGMVAWTERQFNESIKRNDGEPSSADVLGWQKQLRAERTTLMQTAKAATDAGLAERMVRQIELEGRVVSEAIAAALDALGLDADSRMLAIEAAHARLMVAGDDQTIVIDGETFEGGTNGEQR